jgi:hypothetical protein
MGFYHGHRDAQSLEGELVLERVENLIRISPAMVDVNEVTEANRHSFPYHGDP